MNPTDAEPREKLSYFNIVKRNYGHWDFVSDKGRLFRLRGTPGSWLALDERARPYPTTKFKTFALCAAFIFEELAHEELEQDEESPGNNKPMLRARKETKHE